MAERYVYQSYGTPVVFSPTFGYRGSSDFAWEHRFTGRRYDLPTGLYHYRHRPYHPDLGRFLTRDPIGYDGGDPNLYAYIGGMPTVGIDPYGLQRLHSSYTNTLQQLRDDAEEGGSLDDRLRSITIRHLLQHRGGWDRDVSFDPMFQSIRFAEALHCPPPAGPGEVIRDTTPFSSTCS